MIYSSLDVTDVTNFKCNRLNLVIMGLWVIFFLPLLKTRKTRILKKWKMKKIAGDIILHLFNKNHNHMRYDSWDKKRHDKIICHFGPFFTFLPPSNPENQNFEKMKKESGDVIILHLCTKNYDQIMYASWDVECYRHFFCHFGPFFALLRHYWH